MPSSSCPTAWSKHFADGVGARGTARHKDCGGELCSRRYRDAYPEFAAQFDLVQKRELPPGWDQAIPSFPPDPKGIASRDSSGQVENAIAQHLPWLVGGAADLAPSTKTRMTFDGGG